jgi:hypothetical protein
MEASRDGKHIIIADRPEQHESMLDLSADELRWSVLNCSINEAL